MPAPAYSVRFLQAHGATTSGSFVVPAGKVAVLRCADAYANVTGDSSIFLHGALGQTIWPVHWPPLSSSHAQWTGRQVYLEGESITMEVDVAPTDAVDYTVSGYLFSAAP